MCNKTVEVFGELKYRFAIVGSKVRRHKGVNNEKVIPGDKIADTVCNTKNKGR